MVSNTMVEIVRLRIKNENSLFVTGYETQFLKTGT